MPKRQVFYSFHYDNDALRVQQVRNMGVIEGNAATTPNKWEEIKRSDAGIKKWINDNLQYKSCAIVLIGSDTANRKWINYEIEQAWNAGKGVVGIYIHNLKCPNNGKSRKGANPFDGFTVSDGKKSLSSLVKCYDPSSYDAYNDIAKNIDSWIEKAIEIRNNFKG